MASTATGDRSRSGSSVITAEIWSMKMREETDALKVIVPQPVPACCVSASAPTTAPAASDFILATLPLEAAIVTLHSGNTFAKRFVAAAPAAEERPSPPG